MDRFTRIKEWIKKLGSLLLPFILKGSDFMSVKQDRVAARTATDIERKYNFGKKFSEILGLIDDSREKVDSVESELKDEITKTATELSRDTESVNIAVKKITENGVDRVETATGYRLDADGLNISKAGEEMTNLLDNTGMYVKRSGEDILVANNKGVQAVNLHAKTYLIIGSGDGRSRLEDYGADRTGVFWVG